jgi:hypothetical protein
VNVRLFARREGTAPIPVSVTLWDLQGADRVVYSDSRDLTHTGDERTAFRFTIDQAGKAGAISHLPASIGSNETYLG